MKEKISNIKVKYEFVLEDFPFIKKLRDNNRHFTYLSKDKNGREAVIKVAKTNESANILNKETYRIQNERGKYVSGPEIITYGNNYFVAVNYKETVGELVDELDLVGNNGGLNELFAKIINGTFEISHEISNQDNIDIAKNEAKKRTIKYSGIILKHAILQRVDSILGNDNDQKINSGNGFEQRKIPNLPIGIIMKSCMEFLKYKPDGRSTVKNHSCLHLDHLYNGDGKSGKFVAIDWEHSELQPYRYEFLDEAYIFQNLLQKHSENSAKIFYKEFISRHISVLKSEERKIKVVFIKKLLGGLFEMLEDKINNPNPYEKIVLHLKYLKLFLESKDISSI